MYHRGLYTYNSSKVAVARCGSVTFGVVIYETTSSMHSVRTGWDGQIFLQQIRSVKRPASSSEWSRYNICGQ